MTRDAAAKKEDTMSGYNTLPDVDEEALDREFLGGEQPGEQPDEQADPNAAAAIQAQGQEQVPPDAQAIAPDAAQQQAQSRQMPIEAYLDEKGKRQHFESILRDPNALANHAASMGYQLHDPRQQQLEPIDPDLDIAGFVSQQLEQALTPLQQQIQAQGQYIAHLEATTAKQAQMEQIAADPNFGPDAVQNIKELDQRFPHLANLPPDVKHYAMLGLKNADPALRQQQIQAAAATLAEQQVADALKGNKKAAPVTLSGVPPAENDFTGFDTLSNQDMLTMDESRLDRMFMSSGQA